MIKKIQLLYKLIALFAILGAILVFPACDGGNGTGLAVSGRPLGEGGDVPLAPTLESIQANIFDPSCTVCHSGASARQGLRLDSANSFANLVGVPSNEVALLRVMPGEPDLSYLVQKLEGTESVGGQMPLGGPAIPQATIDFVRQWIIDGALADSGFAFASKSPVVIAFMPDPAITAEQFPDQFAAAFSNEIDASTVNSLTVRMIRSGGDNTFFDGNEVTVELASIGMSSVNPRLLIIGLAGTELVEDRYQIILKGTGANVILDINGVAIDGGDFIAEIQLQVVQP